jgi:hypothetical protein
MTKSLRMYGNSLAIIGSIFLFIIIGLGIIASQPKTAAQEITCRVAIVLDRSGSVTARQLDTMKAQVMLLFDPTTGMGNPNINIGFWSFSAGNGRSNYNAPFNTFVSSTGNTSAFETSLNRMISSGGTNYEQGFGYHNGTINTFDRMNDSVIKPADIIVFMTDGLPNVPGNGDGNNQARQAGRNAVLKLKAGSAATGDPKVVVGGIIGNASPGSLNYVVNGADSNSTDLFRISSRYDDLSIKLKDKIGTKCNELFPPQPAERYSLTPTVSGNDRVLTGTDSATFSYTVGSSAPTRGSDMTNWSVKRLVVPRGQTVDRITDLFRNERNEPFRDGYDCDQLLSLVNDNGTCNDVASGQRVFAPGNTSLDTDAASATNVVIDPGWGVGTKVCHVLTLSKPTEAGTPTDRFSSAKCLTIGKNPFVVILGGDLRVGRPFAGDSVSVDDDETDLANVVTKLVPRNDGKTYGSWAEYGVFTPGIVSGFASRAELSGGYPAVSSNIQGEISRLTFSNADDEYGGFVDGSAGLGRIPDAPSAIMAGKNRIKDLRPDEGIVINEGMPSGVYAKAQGDLIVPEGRLGRGQSVIVYVPDGKAVITGNLTYNDGPYSAISEIPQLVIIAKNIEIDPKVSNVDAWLIATGKGNDGKISTCNERVNPDDGYTLTSQICNVQLRINGAVMARYLDLRRTGPAVTGAPGSSDIASAPAEVINLPGSTFLWSQSQGGSDVRVQTTFTTELPPYF